MLHSFDDQNDGPNDDQRSKSLNPNLLELMSSAGFEEDPTAIKRCYEIIEENKWQLLLKKDDYYWGALHWAVHLGLKNVVELILKKVPRINYLDTQAYGGITPFLLACQTSLQATDHYSFEAENRNAEDIALMLLEKGCKFEIHDDKRNSPLHYACQSGFKNLMLRLINSGSDENQRNQEGLKPVNLATRRGHTEIVEYLLLELPKQRVEATLSSNNETILMLQPKLNFCPVIATLAMTEAPDKLPIISPQ